MIKKVKGNILDCTEDIICHQVNVQGIMGGGLARQLADRYKGLEEDYKKVCEEDNYNYEELKGLAYIKKFNDKYIANIFSQKPNFDTDYEMLERALNWVKKKMTDEHLSVAIPRNIGNGIANGIDGMAEKIIREVFENTDLEVTMYEL